MKPKFIVTLLAIILFCGNASFSQKIKEVRKTVELNADGKVSINTYKGSITIETWDKAQVDIDAKIEPDGWRRDEEEQVQETEIRIDDSPNSLRIESDYDRLRRHHSHSFWGIFGDDNLTLPFVRYTITMPKTAKLEIKDYKSDSHITDLHAHVRLETYKGTVTVDGLAGSIDLETYKGEVKIGFAKLDGNSKIETEKGRIDINLASNAGCELDLDLGRHADFHSDYETEVKHKHRGEERYSSSINGGGPLLRIETEKGDIRLRNK